MPSIEAPGQTDSGGAGKLSDGIFCTVEEEQCIVTHHGSRVEYILSFPLNFLIQDRAGKPCGRIRCQNGINTVCFFKWDHGPLFSNRRRAYRNILTGNDADEENEKETMHRRSCR